VSECQEESVARNLPRSQTTDRGSISDSIIRPIAGRAKRPGFDEAEDRFRKLLATPLAKVAKIGTADIVVGIPFHSESDTIATVVNTAIEGLRQDFPDQQCIIAAVGSPAGSEALKVIKRLPRHHNITVLSFLLDDEMTNGKGWSVRAIMEITKTLSADLVVLEADLKSRERDGEIEGLAPDWISLLLTPIKQDGADMVVSRFISHYDNAPISSLLFHPLMTTIYDHPIHQLVGAQWGLSQHLLRTYLQAPYYPWDPKVCGYGIDLWLTTIAITSGADIREANLGIKLHHQSSAAKRALVLRQAAEVLFDQILVDAEWWAERRSSATRPLPQPLISYGIPKSHRPDKATIDSPQQLKGIYQKGFNKFHSLYAGIFPDTIYRQLENLAANQGNEEFAFPVQLWAESVFALILAYAFGKKYARDDLLDSLVYLHGGFMAGFSHSIETLRNKLGSLPADKVERLTSLESEKRLEELIEAFLQKKPEFLSRWEKKAEALKPPVPQVTYREFIPGVPLVVPTELTNPQGKLVRANGIYSAVFTRQKLEFERFVYDRLQVPKDATSEEIAMAIKGHWHKVESRILPQYDLSTIEGTQELAKFLFDHIKCPGAFTLIPNMAYWFLWQHPPSTLFTRLGYGNLSEMLQHYDPLDILALANWSEDREYEESLWKLIRENIRSEHFTNCGIKPLVVSHTDFPALVEMKDSSDLNKLTCRIVISNLHKGMGGEFPKLRYITTIGKNIVEAERFGWLWQRFARERKDFGRKVIDSLQGHWGREPLSAHSLFEDGNQRLLAKCFHEVAQRIADESNEDQERLALAQSFNDIADSYHLALTLADGTFVTCSAWSWAAYSFKGGRSLPPPLSLHLERDWTSREFLVEYFKAAGGTEDQATETIIELMGQGREWENLVPTLFGTEKGVEEIVSKEAITPPIGQPHAESLTRFPANPILMPIKEHPWESKYVLNTGAIHLNGKFYLAYRAYGEDKISRLGLAASKDGLHFIERLEEPIFEPKNKSEGRGCEDPRLTLIGDRVYMAYTAYDGIVAQIALASIGIVDFVAYRWENWHRHGLVFPGFDDKDAAIFPELFKGKYAMLHRVDPHMWVTYSSHLRCPWPRKEHRILAGSTYGMMWDGRKIGAGAQPVKTRYGWLLITHGVDYAHVYRLGVMLLDLTNPSKLIYRSPNFVLEPEEPSEIGNADNYWVPNVVFTCGALPRENHKSALNDKDELIVYYGAADTVINIATAAIEDLIPEDIREIASIP